MSQSILVYGGTCIQDEANRRLVELWGKNVTQLNPNIDVVVFDSASPFDPAQVLPAFTKLVEFGDNPGHLTQGGKDGAGRTFCAGIEMAIEDGYDYAVHWETDTLFVLSIHAIVAKMHRAGVKVAALPQPQYQFPEWGVSFFNVTHMKDIDFVGKYDWEHYPSQQIPEVRIANMLADDLFLLPCSGGRNDQNQYNVANLAGCFPYGPPSWITHCKDFNVYLEFLRINGVTLK
jgi:hypothetical protein